MPPIITRNHEYAKILSRTVKDNKGFTSLANKATLLDSATVTEIVSGISVNSMTIYDTYDSLPSSNLTKGNQAFVRATSHMYISDSNRWFSAAFINLTPTQTLDPSGNVTLSTDGTSTIVTITATDSDQPESQLSYSIESDGNMLATGTTITQDSSVFTITPLSEDSGGVAGNFTLTFKTTDSVNIATTTKDFSLAFTAPTISGSASTVLLMKAVGSGSDNSSIDYQYGSGFTLNSLSFTSVGDPQAGTFSPYRSGGYSAYFDGGGDWIDYGTVSAIGNVGTGDFTYECWFYNTDLDQGSNPTLFAINSYTNGLLLRVNVTTNRDVDVYIANSQRGFAYTFEENTWYHLIWTRESGTVKMWINGEYQSSFTATMSGSITSGNIRIGSANHNTAHDWQGYITDVRFVNGTAEQTGTSDISVPTERLGINSAQLFTCHLPYIADAAGNATATINGDTKTVPFGPYDYNPTYTANQSAYGDPHSYAGSTYFDGNDYAYANAIGSEYTFGSGNFTVEAWYFPKSLSGTKAVVTTADTTDQQGIWMGTTSNNFYVLTGAGSWLYAQSTETLSLNTWNHLAAVRNGNTVYGYLNGKQVLSYSETRTLTNSNNAIRVGGRSVASQISNGYVSDVRVIKGTAQYTANFTPPSTPNTWVTNTSLLAQNVYSPRVYDAAAGNTFSLLADAQSSTSQRKFTTSSSVYFDGTGDYIEMPDAQDLLTLGTGDFTIECWFRPSVVNINTAIMDFRPDSTTGSYPFIQPHNTNLKFQNVSSGTLTASGVLSANTWIHIAVVRSNGTTTLYTDGTSRDSGVDTTDYAIRSVPNIGKHNYAGSNLNGYLQDLRISKGFARYTAAFTPPTTEFEL